jgi:hypothetical protein
MAATIPTKSVTKVVGLSQISRAILVLACLSPTLFAQDVFIAGTGPWSQPTAWSYGRLPTRSDDCVIPTSSNVSGDAGVECKNFSIATGSSLTLNPGYLFPYGPNLVNQGTINIGPGNGLDFAQPSINVTMSGGGTINLTGSGTQLDGGGSGLVNTNNTIHGVGFIGVTQFTNQALIDANTVGGALQLHSTDSVNGVTNTGTMQASNGGILQLTPSGGAPPFTNTGGLIQALNGSVVQLWGGYVITGGTLSTTGTGTIQEMNVTTLNNVTSNANFQINTAEITILKGTIINNGTITAQHGGLQINGTVTLKGSGSVSGGDGPFIHAFCCSAANLVLQQPLSGGGSIGDTSFTFTNQSTVNANNPSTHLTLTGNPDTNSATMEASGGGTLEIQNTVNNVGGAISAQSESTVLLDYNGTVNGGALTTSGSGSFQTTSGTLDGSTNTVTNAGLYSVASGSTLSLKGTINNTGTFALASGGCLAMSSPTTLTGTGTVQMNGNSCLFGWALSNNLTNKSTIEGSGSIGDSNPMGFANTGTVIANQSTPLTIVSAGTGFSNTGSLIVNAGSEVDVNGQLKNLAKGTLTGGTFSVAGTMLLENAAYTTITSNSANITLTGAGAQISNGQGGPSALAAFAINNSKGIFSVQGGQLLSTTANFSNKGTLTVGAGSGFGTAGTYTQTGGTTTVDGVISAPNGFSLKTGKVYGAGTISGAVTAAAAVTTGDSITLPGVLSVSSYSQTSTGSLTIPILSNVVGTGYGQLASTGAVSLAGKLVLKRKSTYVPAIGAKFTIVTGSAVSGQFASPVLTINSKEHFQINYNSNSVTLTVVAGP